MNKNSLTEDQEKYDIYHAIYLELRYMRTKRDSSCGFFKATLQNLNFTSKFQQKYLMNKRKYEKHN